MRRIAIFVLLFICFGLSACSQSNKGNVATTYERPSATENAADTHDSSSKEPTQGQAATPNTSASIEPTPSTADIIREQLNATDDLKTKLAAADDFYKKDPTASLPVIKELLDDVDYVTLIPDTADFVDFSPLLIDLNNAGETTLVSDTLQKLFKALPIGYGNVDNLLNDKGTYLITAESALKYGHYNLDDPDHSKEDYLIRAMLYQGFSVYMAQFQNLDDELAADRSLAQHVYSLLPEKASTDEQCPYKYHATEPGDGREWDAKRDFSVQMPQLSNTATQPPTDKKALVVFRNNRDGDIENWYVDLSFMPTLPTSAIPESVGDANILITVDTVWNHGQDYIGGTEGYNAVTTITAYDIHSGSLIKELGKVDTYQPGTLSLNAGTAGRYFTPVVDDSLVLSKIGKLINEYVEGK